MKLESIENSTTISAIGHEDDKMQVLFSNNNALYEYWPITYDEFKLIKTSESVMKKLKSIIDGEPPKSYRKL